VGEDIQSQVKAIYQDNSLVGYVVFTQLEKASADSFNYKITIMDENLNDIGVVKFKENKLFLYGVSFESDVLCLTYFKTNFYYYEYKTKKEYKQAQDNAKSSLFSQFLSLDGKIIKSDAISVKVTESMYSGKIAPKTFIASGGLKRDVFLQNVSGKGFALMYGDENTNKLVVYNTKGDQLWQKVIKGSSTFVISNLKTNGQYIYAIIANVVTGSHFYEVLGYHIADSSYSLRYPIKDKNNNYLTIEGLGNDPATGNLYVSGSIVDPKRGGFSNPKEYSKGTLDGVYTLNFNGPKKSDVTETFSYWNDGTSSLFNKRGRNLENDTYTRYKGSFKDFQGNTYFYGTSYIKRAKWGSIASTIITLPLVAPPIWISWFGYSKVKIRPSTLLKQNAKGVLSVENTIDGDHGGFFPTKMTMWSFDTRSYYYATDPEKKNTHLIVNDKNNIFIYSLNGKKVIRTIPHKDGNTYTYVFPAKEGHIMVSEYNKKARSTTVSIESL
jgi:hypothetical protein